MYAGEPVSQRPEWAAGNLTGALWVLQRPIRPWWRHQLEHHGGLLGALARPCGDVRGLAAEEAKAIYHAAYSNTVRGGDVAAL